MEPVKVFWGLVLKPEKRYQQVAEENFHISKACLEPSSAGKGITSVYIEVDNDEFIVCNLTKEGVMSDSLDLNFVAGEKICFRNVGTGTVHLTGYLMPDEEEMPSFFDEGEEEEESEEEEMPALTEVGSGKKNKRKMLEMLNGGKASKKAKAIAMDEGGDDDDDDDEDVEEAIKKAVLMKKKIMKTSKKMEQDEDDDDDDDDDDDNDEEDDEEEDDDDDDDDEDGEDDDDDEEDDDEPVEIKSASNGKAAKKSPEKTPKKLAGETPGKKSQEEKTPKKTPGKENGAAGGVKTPKRTLKGGIQVQDIKIGSGPEAKRGKHVGMLYEGRLATNGKVFDGNFKTQKPFKFRLGGGEVIKGWDVGVEGMKVNGVRELIIPAKMGYGAQGAPPDIPPNAVLKFKVECKYVN
ncbi:hypothetical protein TCAL_15260 [Tigriopus californicus]|uniref:peptidylprolyl isomerase n=1 Tax=Tigriopus californicus TaxID=6832 RepID=A0A553NCH4_TIGCA|nr:46 kDa FK506-binding nuclear protein-like [Tigriopus californicus]TRY63146.1 hypothetical protein TCAL_15260 [Tigriopus californicus]